MKTQHSFFFYADEDNTIVSTVASDPLILADRMQVAAEFLSEQAEELIQETVEGLEAKRNRVDPNIE